MRLNQLRDRAYVNALDKGFHDGEITRLVPVKLALVHTEVSECIEADRKGDDENFAEEVADIFIRLGDLCGMLGIDIESVVEAKMAYNESRPYMHGNKRY
jgi:NTP pyrophosphatase (non-canonical NTP hydrolase)